MKNKTYEEFIQNILKTRGRFACGDEYHERHHIMPKCMDGSDDVENLIDLFAREHYEAHRLLALENQDNYKLVYAWTCMVFAQKGGRNCEISAKEYEEARKAMSKARRGYVPSEEALINMGKGQKKRYENAEERKKASELAKQREARPGYREKRSEIMKKKFEDPELRKRQSETAKKRFEDPKERERLRIMAKERCKDPIYMQKRSESMKGKLAGAKNPTARLVICLDTMVIYEAASLASCSTGITAKNILHCCNLEQKTAGGHRWRFVHDKTRKNGVFIPGAVTLGIINNDDIQKLIQKIDNPIDKATIL